MSWILAFAGFAALIILHELGPLRRGQGGRDARRALLAVLRPHAAALPARRDRVRRRLDPARRLREDHRHEPAGGDPCGGRQPRAYYRQPVWKRLVVISAGPAVNIVLAFLILMVPVSGLDRRPREASRPTASSRSTPSRPPPRVLREGDRIIAVDGRARRPGHAARADRHAPAARAAQRRTAASAAEPVDARDRARRRAAHVRGARRVYDAESKRPLLGFAFDADQHAVGPVAGGAG